MVSLVLGPRCGMEPGGCVVPVRGARGIGKSHALIGIKRGMDYLAPGVMGGVLLA